MLYLRASEAKESMLKFHSLTKSKAISEHKPAIQVITETLNLYAIKRQLSFIWSYNLR